MLCGYKHQSKILVENCTYLFMDHKMDTMKSLSITTSRLYKSNGKLTVGINSRGFNFIVSTYNLLFQNFQPQVHVSTYPNNIPQTVSCSYTT